MGPKQIMELLIADRKTNVEICNALLHCPTLRFRFSSSILRWENGHLVDAITGNVTVVDSKNYGGCFLNTEEEDIKEGYNIKRHKESLSPKTDKMKTDTPKTDTPKTDTPKTRSITAETLKSEVTKNEDIEENKTENDPIQENKTEIPLIQENKAEIGQKEVPKS